MTVGIHRDLEKPGAQSHAPDLQIKDGHDDDRLLEIDLSDHSETPDHHTSWIQMLFEETPVAWYQTDPDLFGGRMLISLPDDVKSTLIRVRARCNLHGVWENTITIQM